MKELNAAEFEQVSGAGIFSDLAGAIGGVIGGFFKQGPLLVKDSIFGSINGGSSNNMHPLPYFTKESLFQQADS